MSFAPPTPSPAPPPPIAPPAARSVDVTKLYGQGDTAVCALDHVSLAIARGKQHYDKRQDQKKADARKEIRAAMAHRKK